MGTTRRAHHHGNSFTLLAVPINPLIQLGIIAVNKDPNICADQENAKPGTEHSLRFCDCMQRKETAVLEILSSN